MTSMKPTPFTTACVALAELLAAQRRGALDDWQERELADALSWVTNELPHLLSSRVSKELDPQDVAQEALSRFVKKAAAGEIAVASSPSGYLLRIATNLICDEVRRGPSPLLSPDLGATDAVSTAAEELDEISRLLDGLASADTVRKALARAYAAGDAMVLEVVHAWLNQAHTLAEAPPSRAVAREVGISKTTVSNALERFRGYLGEVS
jgi:DNA-directed RNA polymerase specialized sigma24 family protein